MATEALTEVRGEHSFTAYELGVLGDALRAAIVAGRQHGHLDTGPAVRRRWDSQSDYTACDLVGRLETALMVDSPMFEL